MVPPNDVYLLQEWKWPRGTHGWLLLNLVDVILKMQEKLLVMHSADSFYIDMKWCCSILGHIPFIYTEKRQCGKRSNRHACRCLLPPPTRFLTVQYGDACVCPAGTPFPSNSSLCHLSIVLSSEIFSYVEASTRRMNRHGIKIPPTFQGRSEPNVAMGYASRETTASFYYSLVPCSCDMRVLDCSRTKYLGRRSTISMVSLRILVAPSTKPVMHLSGSKVRILHTSIGTLWYTVWSIALVSVCEWSRWDMWTFACIDLDVSYIQASRQQHGRYMKDSAIQTQMMTIALPSTDLGLVACHYGSHWNYNGSQRSRSVVGALLFAERKRFMEEDLEEFVTRD